MATGTTTDAQLLGIGAVATLVGVSPTCLRLWESAREIPPAIRVPPDGRRIYRSEDLALIEQRAAKMRRRRPKEAPA